jgi:nucleotide-binding universal stress UspA family protein
MAIERSIPVLQPALVSLQRILLATDLGTVSQAALGHSVALARRYSSRLYLLHVVRPSDQGTLDNAWRDGQRYMTDQFIAGQFDGIENQLMVEAGDVWEVVARKIRELNIDLLALGARPRTGIGKLLLGSVAEMIFRQASCPVLLVSSKASPPIPSLRRILFCTGFSAHSLKAGGYALALAQRQNACLTLLHVIKDPLPSTADRERVRDSSLDRLRSLLPRDLPLACPPEFAVEFGAPAERILATAARQQADLIVLGVRQPAGLARRFKWATAYEVVTGAACPVLTVRMADVSSRL